MPRDLPLHSKNREDRTQIPDQGEPAEYTGRDMQVKAEVEGW